MAYYTIKARNSDGRPFGMIGPMPTEDAIAKGVELRNAGFQHITLTCTATLIESQLDGFLPETPNA